MLKTLLDPKNDFMFFQPRIDFYKSGLRDWVMTKIDLFPVFKKLFGTEKNECILVRFLNDMLDLDGTAKIQQAVLQKTDLAQEASTHKAVILDVLCKDIAGNYYIIETLANNSLSHLPTSHPRFNIKNQSRDGTLQVADEKDFGERAIYYFSKVYGSQLNRGDNYEKLKHVFFLAILNFNLFPDEVPCKSRHVLTEEVTKENFLTGQTYIFLELKKFAKKKGFDPLTATKTEKWAYFFKYSNNMSDEEWEKFLECFG